MGLYGQGQAWTGLISGPRLGFAKVYLTGLCVTECFYDFERDKMHISQNLRQAAPSAKLC